MKEKDQNHEIRKRPLALGLTLTVFPVSRNGTDRRTRLRDSLGRLRQGDRPASGAKT